VNIEGLNTNKAMLENIQSGTFKNPWKADSEFDGLMKTSKNESIENPNKVIEMIDNIDKVKVKLENDLTVENLDKYKEALRSFLHYYTKNELQMESFYVKDSRTYMEKKVNIIKSIDEKMNDLTENLLETNRGHLETLNKIGEIKGLIVNLFV
jgi:uncharacterized protein